MAEVHVRQGTTREAGGGAGRGRVPLALLLVLALAGCAGGAGGATPPQGPAAAPVHAGFDTWRYPGDAVMRAWRDASPYRWVGYYLASPCHREESWMGRREALERMGWGLAVLYVGQQAFEGQPTENPGVEEVRCSSTLLTAEQGRQDARDAASRARSEGFAPGSVIFLDVERMERTPPEMLAYLRAWMAGVLQDGTYRPGLYAHRINAAELYLAATEAYQAAGSEQGPPAWIAGGSGFSLQSPPSASGLPFADVWQGALDVARTWGGTTLQVDENVATRPSPSLPGAP